LDDWLVLTIYGVDSDRLGPLTPEKASDSQQISSPALSGYTIASISVTEILRICSLKEE
jgi:hypothetical protein